MGFQVVQGVQNPPVKEGDVKRGFLILWVEDPGGGAWPAHSALTVEENQLWTEEERGGLIGLSRRPNELIAPMHYSIADVAAGGQLCEKDIQDYHSQVLLTTAYESGIISRVKSF